MKIIVYGLKGCTHCKGFCLYLKSKNIKYEYIEDEDLIFKLGQENNISSAPIININGNYYDQIDAKKIIDL